MTKMPMSYYQPIEPAIRHGESTANTGLVSMYIAPIALTERGSKRSRSIPLGRILLERPRGCTALLALRTRRARPPF